MAAYSSPIRMGLLARITLRILKAQVTERINSCHNGYRTTSPRQFIELSTFLSGVGLEAIVFRSNCLLIRKRKRNVAK